MHVSMKDRSWNVAKQRQNLNPWSGIWNQGRLYKLQESFLPSPPSQLIFIQGGRGHKLYNFVLNWAFEPCSQDYCRCAKTSAEVSCHAGWWLMTDWWPIHRQSILRLVYPSRYSLKREPRQKQVEKKTDTLQDFAQVILIWNWICMRRVWTPERF